MTVRFRQATRTAADPETRRKPVSDERLSALYEADRASRDEWEAACVRANDLWKIWRDNADAYDRAVRSLYHAGFEIFDPGSSDTSS